MKITKFGQSCLLIEENGVRILTDPGSLSTDQNYVKDLDFILITHTHPDHLSLDSLREILKNNPNVKIITNQSVGDVLKENNIEFAILENGQSLLEKNISIEAFGDNHAVIYPSLPLLQNTGYLINKKLLFPGDEFIEINREVEILALPVVGPFLKISEAIDYALKIKPRVCFSIHDGVIKTLGGAHKTAKTILEQNNIEFLFLEVNKEIEVF